MRIQTDRLTVEIAEPGKAPADTFRFDRCGNVSDVVLDGRMHFLASEPNNLSHPSSGGRGLACEFGFDVSEDTPDGERYPKFGVGLILKENGKKYRFTGKDFDIQFFPTSYELNKDNVVFTTEPLACNGYAVRQTRVLKVEGTTLTTEATWENVGEKEITTSEYCHNFISIDGMAVGSDYRLHIPALRDLGTERLRGRRGAYGSLRGDGKGLTFAEYSAIASDTQFLAEDFEEQLVPFPWELKHLGAKACVQGRLSFMPEKIVVWTVDHMVCPEIFHVFTVKPGESYTWCRSWTFNKEI